jgi:hypothetical protein
MASISAQGQIDAATRQVDAASRGLPLISLGAEIHPSDFLTRPANLVGANARVAYWLAVAARPSSAGAASNYTLLGKAKTALDASRAGTPWFDLTPFESDDQAVTRTLYDAEKALIAARRSDIAAIFNGMRGQAPPVASGVASTISRVATGYDLTTPASRSTALAGASITGVLAVSALVVYFSWPFLSAAFVAAAESGAAGVAAGAGERARRRVSGE